MYPEFDYLHIGELGDGTDGLVASFDAEQCAATRSRCALKPTSACR